MTKATDTLKAMQAELTAYVVSQLEAGVTWRKAWSGKSGLPFSATTGNQYKGGNAVWLWYMEQVNGYATSEWGTFKAWKSKGGSVRKGEKSTKIIFFKPIFKEEDGKEVFKYAAIKMYSVFNRDQVDGLPAVMPTTENTLCKHGDLFSYTQQENIKVSYTSRAAYSPSLDMIMLPNDFTDEAGGWSTVAHEMVHSTGHTTRLNRPLSQDKHEYSYEELIAELGSLFVCTQLGLSTDDSKEQSAAYCASWAKVLKSNPDWIWKASNEASKAAAYIMERIAQAQAAA
tara:strand:+ start:1066 stop:1920 length:855 start_codon:yes stop_codon:yes gene_type:complete